MKINLVFLIGIFWIGMGANLNAAVVQELTDPAQLMGSGATYFYGASLYVQEGGVSSPVVGVSPSTYTLLFFDGSTLAGYLWTNNLYNNSGYLPILDGNYYADLQGTTPSSVLGFLDPNGGHFADLYDDGALVLDENITSFWVSGVLNDAPANPGSILFNGIPDGILSMSFDNEISGDIVLIDSASVPEPGAIFLCCFGAAILLKRKK